MTRDEKRREIGHVIALAAILVDEAEKLREKSALGLDGGRNARLPIEHAQRAQALYMRLCELAAEL